MPMIGCASRNSLERLRHSQFFGEAAPGAYLLVLDYRKRIKNRIPEKFV